MDEILPGESSPVPWDVDDHFGYTPPLSVAHQLRDTYRLFAKSLVSRISGHAVTMGQYYILKELWQRKGLTQRELCDRIGIMEPTAVNTLKLMESRGYIRKKRDAGDRRKTNIFLCKKGEELFQKILPFALEVNATAVQGFPPEELQMLRNLLVRMKTNLEVAEKG